ncbi:MAG TPA: translocation/assembly module TamB domain-containing protein, partial [Chitinophagaceae bacterium]|nr:translocation/assembly module TamB domain-containing protein [Chitinophagaceae bacterium]
EKIKTKVEIKKLSIAFPKRIVLEGVYFEDEKKDTLLYGKELRVDIALFNLLSNEVNVQYISLDGIRANIYRINPDTVFNYGYIVKAFAGEQEKKPQPADSTSAMKFNVGKIVLKNISASFKDDATGNNANLYLGNIETEIKTFDPDHLVFNIKGFNADNIDVRFHQYAPLVHLKTDSAAVQQIADTSSLNPSVEIGNIAFKQAHFNYLNDATAMLADIDIGEFITHPSSINLKNLSIALKDIQLNNTTAKITIGKTSKTAKDIAAANTTTGVWKFEIAKTQFSNNHLIYDDSTNPKAASGMDYSHLNMDNLSLDADNFIFTPTEYTGSINNLSFREQSGFYLQKLQTNFLYNDTSAYLKNILVQTDKTILKNNIEIRYHSVKALSEKPGDVYVDATLEHSSIAVKDILTFAPMLAANFKGNEQAVLQLNTIVQGYVKDLSIPAFQLSGLGNTYANVSGTIKGLPDAANAVYNLKIAKLAATKKDIINFIPPKTLSSFRLPETFAITGFFNGSAKAFNTKLLLQTSKGNIDATASMSPNENYNVKAALQNVDAGYLLKQDTLLGKLNMLVIAKGNGFDVKKGNADYNIAVSSAEIKNYNYRNVQVDGNLRNGILNTTANMQDSNITFNLDATANLQNKYPAVQMQLLVDTINLHALHLITDTISMHANIIADIASANPDSLNGQIIINDISVAAQGRNLHTDSIMVRSAAQGMQDSLHIYAGGMLNADLNGSYQLTAIGQSLMATINKYYNLPGADTLQNLPEQNFEFAAKISPGDLLLQFMPELKGSDSIIMNASYKSATNKLEVALKANKIIYGTQQADSLTLIAKTNNDHLDFGLSLQDAKSSSFTLYRTSLNGFIANNQADFSLNIQDQKNKTQYNIAGLLSQAANGVKFNLKPGALVLNYDEWTAAADNFIQYDSIGLLAHNFNISSQGQSLTVNSNPQQSNAPLTAAFNNFKIGTLTKIANQTSLNIDGNINGNLVIKDATKNAVFTSDLNLSNLTYNNDTLGNMLVQVNNEQANAFAAHIAIEGKGNDVKLDGMYYTGESRMDFKLNMQQLNLALAKPFAAGQLTDIKGVLQGNIHITGTTALPAVNGDLNFKDAFITPAALGEEFKLSDEKIAIDQQGIHFNNFTLLDSASNEAVINGDILTADFKNFNFAVDLDAEDFVLVNAKQSTNKSFYGKLNITANIKTRGSLESLKTDADIRINKETDFTFVLPGENPEIQERKGVVEFVDKDHPEDTLSVTDITDTLTARTEMKGMDVSATIETDSSAQFTLVIDERNGDALTLKGRSDLAGGIDKSGKLSLTGNYELQHGSYQVSLTVLKR